MQYKCKKVVANVVHYEYIYIMFSLKKWFTLIEIVVVLGIISILFGISMQFGRDRLSYIDVQYQKETLWSDYTRYTTQTMMTKRHDGQVFSGMTVAFEVAKNTMNFEYSDLSWTVVPLVYDNIFVDKIVWHIFSAGMSEQWQSTTWTLGQIFFEPFAVVCTLTLDGEVYDSMDVVTRSSVTNQPYCFNFAPKTCKITECSPEWL